MKGTREVKITATKWGVTIGKQTFHINQPEINRVNKAKKKNA
jgi:hypothetical protein